MFNIGNIFAFPYALGLWARNLAFDKGWIKSVKFDNVAILSFGNITVGGTGKTPHVEYFIRHLLDNAYRVAVISRGYGRQNPKTSRFVEVDSRVEDVGDEPLEVAQMVEPIIMSGGEVMKPGTVMLRPLRDED